MLLVSRLLSSPLVALLSFIGLSVVMTALACSSSDSAPLEPSNSGGNAGATANSGGAADAGSGVSGSAASIGGAAGGMLGSAGSAGSLGEAGASGTGGPSDRAGSGGLGGMAPFIEWPGQNAVTIVDNANVFGTNLSGLFYEPAIGASPAVLWAVQNSPSTLYRLLWDGTVWAPDTSNEWTAGHTLTYESGMGSPDSEGVTKTGFGDASDSSVYVSTERDNDDNGKSLKEVLLFDGSATTATISATREWNLTPDLPPSDPNLGLEAIAWVPDAFLTSKGFLDESTHAAYDPAQYPNHAGGIFFVGLEGTGTIYGYALNHTDSSFTRVATIPSGNPAIMELSFDHDVGYLWAVCDNTCNGRTNVLEIDTRTGSPTLGKFYVRQGFERPSSVADLNDEGFTVTTESTCQSGFKDVFYSDDSDDDDHAIRRDSIPCGAFLN